MNEASKRALQMGTSILGPIWLCLEERKRVTSPMFGAKAEREREAVSFMQKNDSLVHNVNG